MTRTCDSLFLISKRNMELIIVVIPFTYFIRNRQDNCVDFLSPYFIRNKDQSNVSIPYSLFLISSNRFCSLFVQNTNIVNRKTRLHYALIYQIDVSPGRRLRKLHVFAGTATVFTRITDGSSFQIHVAIGNLSKGIVTPTLLMLFEWNLFLIFPEEGISYSNLFLFPIPYSLFDRIDSIP